MRNCHIFRDDFFRRIGISESDGASTLCSRVFFCIKSHLILSTDNIHIANPNTVSYGCTNRASLNRIVNSIGNLTISIICIKVYIFSSDGRSSGAAARFRIKLCVCKFQKLI